MKVAATLAIQTAAAALCLFAVGCRDEAAETLAVSRCESLLAAQELGSLPEPLRSDPRAAIKPKGEPRISDGERTTFVRRAYDRLIADTAGTRIEPRDFTCKFDKKAGKVIELSTNGHTQEIRDSDDEWAIKQRASSSPQ
ncbi:hypothetical protein [Sphingomonas sp. 1P08PE]|uniref:hypothetical protein n=1 Tax=Sphingomonas sp. 1P08PE TaxID=554122 RepID=UPI00399EEE29